MFVYLGVTSIPKKRLLEKMQVVNYGFTLSAFAKKIYGLLAPHIHWYTVMPNGITDGYVYDIPHHKFCRTMMYDLHDGIIYNDLDY